MKTHTLTFLPQTALERSLESTWRLPNPYLELRQIVSSGPTWYAVVVSAPMGAPSMASTWCSSSPQWIQSTLAGPTLGSAPWCPKDSRKLGKTSLETHQECHRFEVSDDLPAVLIIHQGVQQCLDSDTTGFVLVHIPNFEPKINWFVIWKVGSQLQPNDGSLFFFF